MRLDLFIPALWPQISRSLAQRLCEDGAVWVNSHNAKKNIKIQAGDLVEVWLPAPAKLKAQPENLPIEIVYEDKNLVVVNKPQGMVVHPAPGNPSKTLVNALLHHCGGLSDINGIIRPGIVHRIDKDTSGLLVVAKDNKTHLALAGQFAARSVQRVYYAVVHGKILENSMRIDAPIGRHTGDRKKMQVTCRNSKNAVTVFEVVERFEKFTLLRLQLETGRTHQIRVHMAHIGRPVAGDPIYAPSRRGLSLSGQCLHAAVLGFIHPATGKHMRFETPLPDWFEDFLNNLRQGEHG